MGSLFFKSLFMVFILFGANLAKSESDLNRVRISSSEGECHSLGEVKTLREWNNNEKLCTYDSSVGDSFTVSNGAKKAITKQFGEAAAAAARKIRINILKINACDEFIEEMEKQTKKKCVEPSLNKAQTKHTKAVELYSPCALDYSFMSPPCFSLDSEVKKAKAILDKKRDEKVDEEKAQGMVETEVEKAKKIIGSQRENIIELAGNIKDANAIMAALESYRTPGSKVKKHLKNNWGKYALGVGGVLVYKKMKKAQDKGAKKDEEIRSAAEKLARERLFNTCALSANNPTCQAQVLKPCLANPSLAGCSDFNAAHCGSQGSSAVGQYSNYCVEVSLSDYCLSGNAASPGCELFNNLSATCKQGNFFSSVSCKPEYADGEALKAACAGFSSDPFCKYATRNQYANTIVRAPASTASQGNGGGAAGGQASGASGQASGASGQAYTVNYRSSGKKIQRETASGEDGNSDVYGAYGNNLFSISSRLIREGCQNGELFDCRK